MKSGSQNSGFTLIEMVVVVAIIAILISMVFGVATRVEEQGKIRLCKDTLALIGNALEQFRDFGYEYKNDYEGLKFPLDCNNLNATDLTGTIRVALGLPLLSSVTINLNPADPNQRDNSGSEALYFFLNQVPDSRATLGKIDKSLLSYKDKGGREIYLVINGVSSPLIRIIDPWKMPLRYDYYPDYTDYLIKYPTNTWPQYLEYRNDAKLTFPVITSAGPDKKFGTKDDITNR